jgi:amino acid adenylation domain-containing protein
MPNEILEGFPLSPQQENLWQLPGGMPASYRALCTCSITGALDAARLEEAIGAVVLRNEILRTGFQCLPGMSTPLQRIADGTPRLRSHDWRSLSPAAREDALAALLCDFESPAPDLATGEPLDTALVILAPTEHLLVLSLPALCADAVSLANLTREIARSYTRSGDGTDEADEPLQYVDITQALLDLQDSDEAEEGKAYWRLQNRIPGPVPLLFAEAEPRGMGGFQPRTVAVSVDPSLIRRAETVARLHGGSAAALFLGCWQLLLCRLTGRPDVPVAVAVDGRRFEGLDHALGLFARHLPLPSTCSPEMTLTDLLRQVEEGIIAVTGWQDWFSWEGMGDGGREDRFWPYCFEHLSPVPPFAATGVTFLAGLRRARWDRFDLKLVIDRHDGEASIWIEHDAGRIEPATARRMAELFRALLEDCLLRPTAALGALSLLTEGERRQILVERNATRVEHPDAGSSLHRLVEAAAERSPEAVAVVWDRNSMSYRELERRAERLAHRLRRLGVGAESRVAVSLERSPQLVVAFLGVLKAGAAYVPLDPEYPAERRSFMMADSGARLLLTTASLAPADAGAAVLLLDEIDGVAGEAGEMDADLGRPDIPLDPASAAYVIYTSGSTGRPKGVVISHRAILNRLLWMQRAFPLSAGDRVLQKTPYGFDASVWEIFSPLLAGAQLVLAPPGAHRDTARLVALIAGHGVTRLQLVPSLLGPFLAEPDLRRSVTTLRHVFCGGEALLREHCERFHAQLGGVALCNLYGPTEAAIDASFHLCTLDDAASGAVPIGRPLDNVQIYVLDADLQPVPTGLPGALHIGGAGLSRGYLGRPGLTAERFLPDPFGGVPGGRLYATGDLARQRPDGALEYLGRTDDQVKIHGVRIELGEIESLLAEHPEVGEAAVVARREGGAHLLTAYVAPAPRRRLPPAEALREHLRARLPEAMVPSLVVFLDVLPRLPNGKVNRRALPDPEQLASRPPYVEPRSRAERLLAGIWSELLGVDRVGLDDNFFALGGDSILSIQVVSRALRADLQLSAQHLFSHQTLAELAAVASWREPTAAEEGDRPGAAPPWGLLDLGELERELATGGPLVDAYPLSPLQEGLLFQSLYAPGSGVDVGQMSYRLQGVDTATLSGALQRIVERHPILRTSFHWSGADRPLQVVHRTVEIRLERESWRHLTAVEQEARLQALLQTDRERGFDPAEAPLTRWTLIEIGDRDVWLLWSYHHILLDGWSFTSLAGELLACYEALQAGGEPQLAERRPYRDYIAWLAAQDRSGAEGYWRSALAGWTEPASLGAEPAGGAQGSGVETQAAWLSPELSAALQAQARRHQLTLNVLVQGAWGELVGRYSGQTDVVFGAVSSGRPGDLPGVESILGLFINTLPVRISLAWPGSLAAWLKDLQMRQAEQRRYETTPLVDIQGWSAVPRGTALFESLLVFENFPGETAFQGAPSFGVTDIRSAQQTGYPLTLIAVPGDELRLRLSYQPARFDAPAAIRLLGHLENLLAALACRSLDGLRPGDLPLLSAAERQQLLVEWNATETRETGTPASLEELIAGRLAEQPDAAALLFAGAGGEAVTWSYRELFGAACSLTRRLRRSGVGPDVVVALCAERSPEMVVGVLAVLLAGGACLPLDPAYPSERLALMLADSRAAVLLAQEHLLRSLPPFDGEIVTLTAERVTPDEDGRAAAPAEAVSPESLAYVIYTSGSTGRPKGVALSRGALANLLAWQRREALPGAARTLQFSSLSFDVSFQEIASTLIAGGTLALVSEETRRDPRALLRLLDQMAVERLFLPFVALRGLAEAVEAGAGEGRELLDVVTAGEALTVTPAIAEWMARRPGRRLHNQYGPSESHVVTALTLAGDPRDWPALPPIGRPIGNVRIYLLDALLRPVPVGVPGELCIGGAALARGYLGRPELTAERFVPDAWSGWGGAAGERIYRTGDLARYRADGQIEFLGRRDHQVKIRGIRVEPGEIEAALEQHPAVRHAVVVPESEGTGGLRLAAYFVAAETGAPEAGALRELLASRLPAALVPSRFVALPAMPLTPSGKVDRRALAHLRSSDGRAHQGGEAPRTPVEQQLAHLWAELLGLEQVGREDNFFALGGHSLLAVSLMSRVHQQWGRELPLYALFAGPTVAQLAEHLQPESAVPAWSPLVCLQPGGSRPPFFCVHAIGGGVASYYRHLVRHLGPDQPFYGFQASDLGAEESAPQRSIDAMASAYVEEMMRVQPQGPYLLGGASFGGLVAFEMARLLALRGEEVALLALIDPLSPRTPDQVGMAVELDEVRLVCAMAHTVAMEEERTLSLTPQDLAGLPRDEMLQRALQVVRDAGIAGPEIDLAWAHRYLEGFRSRMQAAYSYRAERYQGGITLLSTAAARAGTDPGLPWRGLAAAGVEIHPIPGTHESMLLEPNVQELAGILGRCLSTAANALRALSSGA